MNQETTKILVGTVSGLIVGGFVGYYFTKRALSKEFDALLDTEVAKVKEYYKQKTEEITDISEVALQEASDEYEEEQEILEEGRQKHAKIVTDSFYNPSTLGTTTEEPVEPVTSDADDLIEPTGFIIDRDPPKVFGPDYVPPPLMEGGPIDYNDPALRNMIQKRDPSEPYLITVDEFMDDNPEFDKQNVTYFEGDDSLCDERDMLIPDIDENVGRKNLENFGLYSRDSEIVYVRNERISVDFEIAYDPRTYVEAIAGFKFRNVVRPELEDD